MFYYKILWFYQDFKSVFFKSVLRSRSENTGTVTIVYKNTWLVN